MGNIIVHVDMDAFYAAVEMRDNPDLKGKPLIIGALPHERGVVSTCSYEARKYGVRSAMSIKEAYRRCPQGIYMHPNMRKYKTASDQVHEIWSRYTDMVEYVSLDEGYLDVTGSEHLFGGARSIGYEIKDKTKTQVGLTCSVGVGYTMMAAKLGSEEKKPDGYFEILSPEALRNLIIDRGVRIIYGVGEKTAAELALIGIQTVRELLNNRHKVLRRLGNHGQGILDMADGIDGRKVTPYSEVKSIGKENTFQEDTTDFEMLMDYLLLTANELSYDLHLQGLYCRTITLKITYSDMRQITRSKSGEATNRADDIYAVAAELLDKIDRRPVRLTGISLSGLTDTRQLSIIDTQKSEEKDAAMFALQRKYGRGVIKTANELGAEERLRS